MRTSLNINIPEPCHEDWNKMTRQDKGRHCTSCVKTVFDFTTKTDEQIVKTFLNEGKVCGRFKSTQLNRELVLNRKEKNNFLSCVASTLFAFLSFGTQDVEAQGKPRIVNVDSSQTTTVNDKIRTSILKERVINGTIVTKIDGLALPGATVINLRSRAETYSDFDGYFSLKVKTGDSLSYTFVGLESIQTTVDNKNYFKTEMIENPCDLEFISLGFPTTDSNYYYKKKCRKLKRQRKRIEKLQNIKNGELERTSVGKLLFNVTNIFRRKE